MKIRYWRRKLFWQLDMFDYRPMEPPIKRRPIEFTPPPVWPELVLGGMCEGQDWNSYRCTGVSEVDTGYGCYCRVCQGMIEGWL